MTDYDAMLGAVLATPCSDLPRLVFADLLDAMDRPGDAGRAEFIRAQCELARMPECLTPSGSGGGLPCHQCRPRNGKDCLSWCEVCRRQGDLWKTERAWMWGGALVNLLAGMGLDVQARVAGGSTDTSPRGDTPFVTLDRGFVSEIWCTEEQFLGRLCQRCGGTGRPTEAYPTVRTRLAEYMCSRCLGEGWVKGLVKKVFSRHPVTKVILTDRKPLQTPTGFYAWSYAVESGGCPYLSAPYMTEAEAWDYLSLRHVNMGRNMAGLRPLPEV